MNQTAVSQSTNEGFVYSLTFSRENPLLATVIPNFGEMTIDSEWFADHRECRDDLLNLLSSIKERMEFAAGRKFIIATKLNPMYDSEFDGDIDTIEEEWGDFMVCKCFIADEQVLKEKGLIDSSVIAIVQAEEKINLMAAPVNTRPQ